MQPSLVKYLLSRVRLVKPGLLSLAGAVGPLALGWYLLSLPGAERPEESYADLVLGRFFVVVGLVFAYFALNLMVDEAHHVFWGRLILVGNAMTGLVFTWELLSLSLTNLTLFLGLAQIGLMTSAAVGVVGGVLGVFWKRSWWQGATIPGLAGPSRKALVGAVILFFMILPARAGFLGPWLLLAAFLVIVFSVLVYKGRGDPKLLGVLIIAGSTLAGYLFYGGDVYIGEYPITAFPVYAKSPFLLYTRIDPAWTTWAFIGLAGLVLAITGGLQILFWKKKSEP